MATKTSALRGGTVGASTLDRPRGVLYAQIDLAEIIADEGAIASGDLIQVVSIPNGTRLYIHAVRNETALSLGTSGVLELGDAALGGSGDDDRYVANQTTMTANSYATIEAAGSTGTVYNVADVLSFKVSNSGGSITAGKIGLFYELIDLTAIADGKPSF
jgi:hypothetical protein